MCSMGLFSGLRALPADPGHRLAPAAVLAPFIYTEIVWMIALGFLVFGDVPNRWTLAGVAVVIVSGLYLLYRERVVGTAPAARLIDFPCPPDTNPSGQNRQQQPFRGPQ